MASIYLRHSEQLSGANHRTLEAVAEYVNETEERGLPWLVTGDDDRMSVG